jgi:hypothetical protein
LNSEYSLLFPNSYIILHLGFTVWNLSPGLTAFTTYSPVLSLWVLICLVRIFFNDFLGHI